MCIFFDTLGKYSSRQRERDKPDENTSVSEVNSNFAQKSQQRFRRRPSYIFVRKFSFYVKSINRSSGPILS